MNRRVLVRRLVSILLLTVVVTGVAWIGLSAEVFGGFQRRATDALFPGAPTDKNVVVVGIDRKAINHFQDPLPWPRARMAALTDQLSQAGAAVIVFDVVFSQESDRPADDDAFAAAIQRAGDVVFGEGVSDETAGKNGAPPLARSGTASTSRSWPTPPAWGTCRSTRIPPTASSGASRSCSTRPKPCSSRRCPLPR